ncbi:MAG TPA: alcohol dehydrogenase catalytic domain-containing protein [Candidatus Eisenbacteria bacterium]|nr:alcohol dehydrogenase catalytic domain-containing protein [Candidatus Eisenbacteria bacterium]
MKAVHLRARADPATFIYEDAQRPEPGAGEVLVRVHAAAVTPTELEWEPTWTTRAGGPRPFPITSGHEFSGEIAAVGPGVADLAPGDAVSA